MITGEDIKEGNKEQQIISRKVVFTLTRDSRLNQYNSGIRFRPHYNKK